MAILDVRSSGVLLARNLLFTFSALNMVAPAVFNNPAQAIGSANRHAKVKASAAANTPKQDSAGSGELIAMSTTGKPLGKCPLSHTDVTAQISGYMARVHVKQSFQNPFNDKIEATYTFPLSDTGAVDSMVMRVGNRTIKGQIKTRDDARKIYDDAKNAGHVASLLDQERANIFTQSVANIEPGKTIEITIDYVELLSYDAGKFSFVFPTVVGPRFMPGQADGAGGTDQVPDAARLKPPVVPTGERSGHDISINVNIDSGVPIHNLSSKLHEILINQIGNEHASLSLKDKASIANKDFVLTWDVAADKMQSGYLTYRDPAGKDSGFFTLMLMPPKQVTPESVAPKEMIFLIDCSGSQSGAPLQKAKEALSYIVNHMNPNDTFQILAFSNDVRPLFKEPEKVSPEMRTRALAYIDKLEANGGTWMAPAIEQACAIPADSHRLRIVTFMTDGFVGNDYEIIGMIKKLRAKSRWFSFGTGNSVNRWLIDEIAREGGGDPDYVLLNSSAEEVGKKFYQKIASPVLTDVKVEFDGVQTKEVFPKELSDVWAQKPLYVKGRYTAPGAGTVTLSGYAAGKPYKQTLHVEFPQSNTANPALPSIWARAKVDRLESEDMISAQTGKLNAELKSEIIKTALDYHIMTAYTSFVAVEEKSVVKNGIVIPVSVPVEIPDGVDRLRAMGSDASSAGFMVPAPMGGGGGAFLHSAGAQFAGRASMAPAKVAYKMYSPGPMQALSLGASPAQCYHGAAHPNVSNCVPAPPAVPRPQATDIEFTEQKKLLSAVPRGGADKGKLDWRLQNLVANHNKSANDQLFEIKNGKITVKLTVKDLSKELIAKLKQAGFTVLKQNKTGWVVGQIDLQKLKTIAGLPFVVTIVPYRL